MNGAFITNRTVNHNKPDILISDKQIQTLGSLISNNGLTVKAVFNTTK